MPAAAAQCERAPRRLSRSSALGALRAFAAAAAVAAVQIPPWAAAVVLLSQALSSPRLPGRVLLLLLTEPRHWRRRGEQQLPFMVPLPPARGGGGRRGGALLARRNPIPLYMKGDYKGRRGLEAGWRGSRPERSSSLSPPSLPTTAVGTEQVGA